MSNITIMTTIRTEVDGGDPAACERVLGLIRSFQAVASNGAHDITGEQLLLQITAEKGGRLHYPDEWKAACERAFPGHVAKVSIYCTKRRPWFRWSEPDKAYHLTDEGRARLAELRRE